MDNVWTNLGNRLETAWKRPTRPNSKRPKDGDIIPKITMVELEKRPTDAVPYDMAKQVCPVCGAPIAPVNGSVDLYCTNAAPAISFGLLPL